jgi:hypothetical protein
LINGEIVIPQNIARIDSIANLCADAPPILLSGFPIGGRFSGTGVSQVGSQYFFNPGVSFGTTGVGTFAITYSVDSAGCTFNAYCKPDYYNL